MYINFIYLDNILFYVTISLSLIVLILIMFRYIKRYYYNFFPDTSSLPHSQYNDIMVLNYHDIENQNHDFSYVNRLLKTT